MKKIFLHILITILTFSISKAQDKTCLLRYSVGQNLGFWSDNSENNVCKGGQVKIVCETIQNASYKWRKDGLIIPNEIKATIFVSEDGIYTAEAQNSSCLYVSPKVTVKTNSQLLNLGIKPDFDNNHFGFSKEYNICSKGEKFIANVTNTISQIIAEATYQWQKDGVDIDGATGRTLQISKEGLYSARVRQGECYSIFEPVKINIVSDNAKVPLQFEFGINSNLFIKDTLQLCEGSNIKIGGATIKQTFANGTTNYKWFKNNQPIDNGLNHSLNATQKGTYFYESLLPSGCKIISNSLYVDFVKTINKPKIEMDASAYGCTRDVITFDAFSKNLLSNTDSPKSVNWFKNGQALPNATGLVLSVTESNFYKVAIKVGNCNVESDNFKLDYSNAKPRLIKLISPLRVNNKVTVCPDESVNLNFPFFQIIDNIQWYRDGVLILKGNQNLYAKESGKYYAIYPSIDNSCKQYSDTVEVIIPKLLPSQLTQQILNCNTFKLSIPKTDGVLYSWKKDGKVIPNANVNEFFPKETGNYSVVSNLGYCPYESNLINFQETIISSLKNINVCEGSTVELLANQAETYLWTGPNNFSSTLRNPTFIKAKVENAGFYKIVINRNGCKYTDSISVKINPNPIISVQIPETICFGKPFTITVKSTNNSAFYSIVGPDNTFSAVSAFSWTRDNATKQMVGIYTTKATDPNTQCFATTTTNITIEECPTITIADLSKLKLCYGSEIEVPFSTSGKFAANTIFTVNYIDYEGKYQVLGTGTKSPIKIKINGNYRLIITSNDRNISSSPDNYLNYIYVNSPYIINHTRYACTGYKVDMQVDTNSTYYRYDKFQWKLNGKIIEGATKLNYSASQSGGYTVDVSQNGCTVSKSDSAIIVTIGKLDKPYNYALTAPYVCEGYSVDLTSSNYPKDVSFQWNFEGKPIEKMNASTIKATKNGAYTLTVKQGTCEATSDPTQVNVGDILPNKIVGNGSYSSNYDPSQVELCKGSPYRLFYQPYANSGRFQDSVARRRGFQLQWQKDGVDIEKADSLSYKIEKDGNYRLKISQGTCVAYSKTTQIKFSNRTKLSMYASSSNAYSFNSKNISTCSGDSLQLYFYGSSETYYYFPTTIYSNDKVLKELPKNKSNFYASKSGNYWVTQSYPIAGSQETCIATSDTLNIKIGGTKIEVLSENISTCLDTVRLYNNYQNGKMRWKFDGNYLPKDTLYSIKAYQSGTYQWEANTNNCQIVSKPFSVTFGKLEATLESPYKNLPCYGEVLSLSPSIKSYLYYYNSKDELINPPTFQWQKDGLDFSKNSYIDNVQKGIYSVTIKQGKCSVTTNPFTIDFKNISRDISPKDSATFCPNGGFVELSSAADATYKFIWAKDKKVIPNQIKSTIKASESGIYQTQIESGDCATLSFPVKVFQKTILPTAIISGSKEINVGDSTRVKIDLTSSAPWTLKLTNNQTFTAEKTPYEFSVKPLQSTTYELASLKNTCGEGTFSGKAEVKITVLGNEEIAGANIKLFPIPAQNSCQLSVETTFPAQLELQLFSLDGKLISKTEKSKAEIAHSQTINLESSPSGTYLLKIFVGEKMVSRKIVKEN